MPLITVGLIIFIWALWKLMKMQQKRYWATTLLIPAALTIGLAVYTLHELYRTNCGQAFDPDTGCTNVMPDWIIPVGMMTGLITFIIAVAIIVKSRKEVSKSKK